MNIGLRFCMAIVLAAGAAGFAMPAARAAAADPSAAPAAHTLLSSEFGVGAADLRDLERRRSIGRSLPTQDSREVATLGAVHLRVPARFYLDQLRDVVSFKQAEAVQQIGTFGHPARVEDVAGLTIPDDQLERLRRCRPHDCNLQLSAAAIARFQAEVDWNSPRAAEGANAVLRRILVDLVNQYRSSGAAALMEYNDRRQPLATAHAFATMVAERPVVLQRYPALYRHVVYFPAAAAPDVQDVIYWSREKMGPAVIISVTHMAYATLDAPAGAYAVASKQLYGSQYFDASLGLTLVLPDAADRASAYLVYVNRSRLDVLGGVLGALKRPIVRSRTRSAVADHMIKVRDMVERRYAARNAAATAGGAPAAQAR
jgi:hypothetical protein